MLELRECQQPFFSFLLPQNAALFQRVATAIFCLVSAESARAAIAGCVCHFEAVVTCVDAVKVDSFKLFMASRNPANALPCERAESQWKGSNVRRARARLLLDEGADLFGAALTQVPHTGTHQAKIAAA